MSVRIINVFYNDRGLPYQDQERTVLFPILGNAFLGASNTTQIRFYCDKIGGGRSNAVVYGKLANGKKVFTILGEYTEDSALGESYYTFSLDSHYTECKGDLMLSLGTYNGNLIEQDVDTTYELTGNTVIEMTGVIKLNIAYAVVSDPSDEQIDTWQELLGALGEKADKNKVIITFDTESAMTSGANAYEDGQYFFVKATQTIYQKLSGVVTPILVLYSKSEVDSLISTLSGTINIHIANNNNPHNVTKAQLGLGNVVNTSDSNTPISGGTTKFTTGGAYTLKTNLENELGEVALNFIDKYVVGYTLYCKTGNVANNTLTISGTINDNTINLISNNRIDNLETTKVDKTNSANKVYATDNSGNQTTISVDSFYEGNIVRRDSDNSITVPLTPTQNGYASSKKYVDDGLALKANQATTYTKNEVNNLIDTIKTGELILVDTTTYPTLNDFLATDGEEGHIYLYPIDINDLTKGYYRYVWEDIGGTEQWVSLGTTEIDLTNYATLNTTQTFTGEKTFVGDLKFQGSGTTTIGQITTTNYAVKIGYGGVNHITIGGNNFYTNVADYDLGSNSNKWRDLYLSRNLTDGTYTIAVANIVSTGSLLSSDSDIADIMGE